MLKLIYRPRCICAWNSLRQTSQGFEPGVCLAIRAVCRWICSSDWPDQVLLSHGGTYQVVTKSSIVFPSGSDAERPTVPWFTFTPLFKFVENGMPRWDCWETRFQTRFGWSLSRFSPVGRVPTQFDGVRSKNGKGIAFPACLSRVDQWHRSQEHHNKISPSLPGFWHRAPCGKSKAGEVDVSPCFLCATTLSSIYSFYVLSADLAASEIVSSLVALFAPG